jgi:hypothetical protein
MADHAKLSPSSAKRWLTCPASAEAAARSVSPDTEHSKNGTAAHWVRSEWMQNGEPPPVGAKAPNGVSVTADMIELVRPGIIWTRDYIAKAGGPCAVLVEERISIAPYFGLPSEVLFGTGDQCILAPNELVIYDLKAGYVDVTVDENEQLSLYALGMMETLGWLHDKLLFVIDQPKQGGIKEWPTTAAALRKWADEKKPLVIEAASPNARFVPSDDGCRFCPVAGVCSELQKHSLELARMEFSDDPLAIVKNITVDELAVLLTKGDMVEVALKAAREHALKLIQSGVEVPGYKAVEGKKNRAWKEGVDVTVMDNAHALGFDLDKVAPRKLCSPAQAEKLGLKQLVDGFAEKPRGNPVLAPINDKRPALPPHFEVVDAGNLLD